MRLIVFINLAPTHGAYETMEYTVDHENILTLQKHVTEVKKYLVALAFQLRLNLSEDVDIVGGRCSYFLGTDPTTQRTARVYVVMLGNYLVFQNLHSSNHMKLQDACTTLTLPSGRVRRTHWSSNGVVLACRSTQWCLSRNWLGAEYSCRSTDPTSCRISGCAALRGFDLLFGSEPINLPEVDTQIND